MRLVNGQTGMMEDRSGQEMAGKQQNSFPEADQLLPTCSFSPPVSAPDLIT